MTRTGAHDHGQMVVLAELADHLIADLPHHDAGRTARTILTGATMRATMIALAKDHELAEHEAPSAATLYVVKGRIRLRAGDREWSLYSGQLVPIPAERHSVLADSDAAFLLTVALH